MVKNGNTLRRTVNYKNGKTVGGVYKPNQQTQNGRKNKTKTEDIITTTVMQAQNLLNAIISEPWALIPIVFALFLTFSKMTAENNHDILSEWIKEMVNTSALKSIGSLLERNENIVYGFFWFLPTFNLVAKNKKFLVVLVGVFSSFFLSGKTPIELGFISLTLLAFLRITNKNVRMFLIVIIMFSVYITYYGEKESGGSSGGTVKPTPTPPHRPAGR